jgi:hypothetical protein
MFSINGKMKGGFEMPENEAGHYLGTEISGKWWRRYSQAGFLARGNGTYWFEDDQFCFLRYLTSKPLCIPYGQIERTSIGAWHAGRWNLGRPIVKIHWQHLGKSLNSGFVVGRTQSDAEAFIKEIERRIGNSKL